MSAIKTVKQLNGEKFELRKYDEFLVEAAEKSVKNAFLSGLGIAGIFFVLYSSYALGFWFGSRCVVGASNCDEDMTGGRYTAGDVLVIFFAIVMGGMQLSQLTPAFKNISEGRMAASRIFNIIDREPLIQNPPNGIKIENLKGVIKFENVSFRYPKDPSRKVFNNLSMEFDINKTGLVGESGCGKSTTLQLIMRFYDPEEGRVTVDGHDLRTLDLPWWRSQIGYVGQEPVLFATSIKENLRFGAMDATDQDIEEALRMAEAWDFIQTLEDKLETYVGIGGGQLSGGQKQRVAIARAILRKPKIMLLDEATSALDRRNEKLIQETLEKITENMTTITVAHRVKTIMNSDTIYLFNKGGIAEKGKFHEISKFKSIAAQM